MFFFTNNNKCCIRYFNHIQVTRHHGTKITKKMKEQKQMSLIFTLDQCNVILQGLSELQFKVSADVIASLRTQVEEQLKQIENDNQQPAA